MDHLHRIAEAVVSGCLLCCFVTTQPLARAESSEICPVPKVVVPRPAEEGMWPAWVTGRIRELQPTPQERKIDEIGWARTILAAENLARENGRPVFLFTHDGRINTGRC